jgi:hypothetical protein
MTNAAEQSEAAHGSGLHLPVERLLSGKQAGRCQTWEITDLALKLLNRGELYDGVAPEQRFCHQLALVLRPSVLERIQRLPDGSAALFREVPGANGKAKWVLPIKVTGLRVYQFATGRVICQLGLEAVVPNGAQMTPAALTELVDLCGRFPTLGWLQTAPRILRKDGGAEDARLIEMPDFTIGGVIARFVLADRARISLSHRTFTHAFASVTPDGPPTTFEELRGVAARLARQYTTDYALRAEATKAGVVADFDNVVHVIAREGGATIIDPRTDGQPVEFLQTYMTKSLMGTYLPIIALNLHQLAQAMELNAMAVLDTDDTDTVKDKAEAGPEGLAVAVAHWRELEEKLAVLHSRFRFRQISPVSMHNSFNKALRDSFGLDELEQELTGDLAGMSARVQTAVALLEQERRSAFRRQFRWVSVVAAAAAACVVSVDIMTGVLSFWKDGSGVWMGIAGIVALVATGAAAMWTYKKLNSDMGD